MPAKAGIHAGRGAGAPTPALHGEFEGPASVFVDARFRGHDEVEGEVPELTGGEAFPCFPPDSIAGPERHFYKRHAGLFQQMGDFHPAKADCSNRNNNLSSPCPTKKKGLLLT